MYNFIMENKHKVKINEKKGIITTPRGTNGTICTSTGYLRAKVNKRILQAHQILAVAYFGEACIGLQVNHKDGNKLNNKRENLEVVTQEQNLLHQKEYGLLAISMNKVKIDQLDLNGNYIKTYESYSLASKENGISVSGIQRAIKGSDGTKYTQSGGFKWRLSEQ